MRSYAVRLLLVAVIASLLAACGNTQNGGGKAVNDQLNQKDGKAAQEHAVTDQKDAGSGDKSGVNEQAPIEGEQIADAMLAGEYDSLYGQFSDDMKGIVSQQDFIELGKQFTADVKQFELSSTMKLNGYNSYVWRDDNKSKGMMAVVDEQRSIIGFQVLPLTTHPDTDQMYSQTEFKLPFADEWLVFWGGKDVFLNYHYEYEHVRYAYDFIQVKDGYSYNGDPLSNESYYAFGAEVLAPADGEVIAVVDGIADNVPGEMNESQPAGNMVVIQHANGERSMLAHFKQNSITVAVGDQVKAGQLLGECGNSGNSSEAHIHFQVLRLDEGGSEVVVPISFADGKEWVRGETASREQQ